MDLRMSPGTPLFKRRGRSATHRTMSVSYPAQRVIWHVGSLIATGPCSPDVPRCCTHALHFSQMSLPSAVNDGAVFDRSCAYTLMPHIRRSELAK